MKRAFLTSALITAMLSAATPTAVAAPKGWETVMMDLRDTRRIVKMQDVEIRTAPSLIIVTSTQPIRIKVFTILGRLISDETLQPGTSGMVIESHGVYIVKAGELTCKVAI